MWHGRLGDDGDDGSELRSPNWATIRSAPVKSSPWPTVDRHGPDQIDALLITRPAGSARCCQHHGLPGPPPVDASGAAARLYELYLRRHDRIDDWSMVDRAAPWVVGGYLSRQASGSAVRPGPLPALVGARTAITATWIFIRDGQLDDTFALAELLVDDPEHFVQTAVGGWVREAGKHDVGAAAAFLDTYAATMPRPHCVSPSSISTPPNGSATAAAAHPRSHDHGHEARTRSGSRQRRRPLARAFYTEKLGFALDVDVTPAEGCG